MRACSALWLAAGVAGLVAACSLGRPGLELDLALPPLPQAWERAFPELRYEVRFVDPERGTVEAEGAPWVPGTLELAVELRPGECAPVLVTPVVPSSGVRLLPAGAIFPLDVEGDGRTLRVSWERGCAAAVLARLLEASSLPAIDTDSLDVPRLVRDLEDRDADPWNVDVDALLASIVESGGSDWECRCLPLRRVLIPETDLPEWPGVTEYVLDDPLAPPVCPGRDGETGPVLALEDLAVGFHRLFPCGDGREAQAAWLDLYVTETEAVWLTREADPMSGSRAP